MEDSRGFVGKVECRGSGGGGDGDGRHFEEEIESLVVMGLINKMLSVAWYVKVAVGSSRFEFRVTHVNLPPLLLLRRGQT